MYKKNVSSNGHAGNGAKKANKSMDRQVPLPDRKNESSNDFKSKDEQLLQLVREHLTFAGYIRAAEILRTERPNLKAKAQIGSHQSGRGELDKNTAMGLYDRGSREEFFKHTARLWATGDENVKKLEFELQVYFCIYHVHPNLKRQQTMDQPSSVAFKKYLDTKAADLALTKEELSLFAMPYMPKPQENSALSHLFTKQWLNRLKAKLVEFLSSYLKGSIMSQPGSQARKVSTLQDIFASQASASKTSREESKQNCNHSIEIEAVKQENNELRTIIQNYQRKFDEFAESSKQNLYESNQKWFVFSREIFTIAKKHLKEDKLKAIEKYQSFFVGNIEELIDANEISLFDKNSYLEQDLSVNPDVSRRIQLKRQESSAPLQLDFSKIKGVFLHANHKDREVEICTVLRALKKRFTRCEDPSKKREIMVEYSRGDLCGVLEENYIIQKRLLFDSSEKVRELFISLIEGLSADFIGLHYLLKSSKLVENLVGLFSSGKNEQWGFRSVVAVLQRLSFSQGPRRIMVELGIVSMIFRAFRNEGSDPGDFTLRFLTALMMNLSLKKETRREFEKHKTDLLKIVIEHMANENSQVRSYINGTIFLLMLSKEIKEEAVKQKLDVVVRGMIEAQDDGMCVVQYNYLLGRITGEEEEPFEDYDEESDFEEEEEEEEALEECEDFEEEEYGSLSASTNDYLEGEIEIANGEELLFKNYALLGPDAVRQHILTRSVLDETSKRLDNMTTSINRSRRVDNIFSLKGNVTVLGPELDNLLNKKK